MITGQLKSDIINGDDGQLAIQYYKIKHPGNKYVHVEVGLKGNYSMEVMDILKSKGRFDNTLGRSYKDKASAQARVLPLLKEIIERLDSKNSGKFAVKKVTVLRGEGPIRGAYWNAGVTKTFTSIRNANKAIAVSARMLGRNRGYDKHDFTVEWTDGTKYSGRLDVTHPEEQYADNKIGTHIKQWFTYVLNKQPDATLKAKQEAKMWLKKYDMED